ncbi:hypothetical protein TNIN_155001 [Trichonephila inaurata madagascariensis]|uniref:Uncharacterized protein n=1 Tax=Trichonephila inaurata madagascariensis TaxID=2747483 RepID=A0A8X6YKE2_9ARAC|nr:hypothetical protein TNIN_155001 [Trichonephila inaurata madagascariensis]
MSFLSYLFPDSEPGVLSFQAPTVSLGRFRHCPDPSDSRERILPITVSYRVLGDAASHLRYKVTTGQLTFSVGSEARDRHSLDR